jgi:hypothetical protein
MPPVKPEARPRALSRVLPPAAKAAERGCVKTLLLLVLLTFAAWWFWPHAGAAPDWRGRPVNEPPRQTTSELPRSWQRGPYTVTPVARFQVRAVVLSRERYHFDPEAKFAPVDLALGWGRMSEAAVVKQLRITQDHRWYNYSWEGSPPIPPDEIAACSANMHMIPADDGVLADLLQVQPYDLVEFEGLLVDVTRPDWFWRSSRSRSDTGGHACEVVWVQHLLRRRP